MRSYLALCVCTLCTVFSLAAQDTSDFGDEQIKRKKEKIETFVSEAVEFFGGRTLGATIRGFETDSRWSKGGMYPFVFGEGGECYFDADEWNIWKVFGKHSGVSAGTAPAFPGASGQLALPQSQDPQAVSAQAMGVPVAAGILEKPFLDSMLERGVKGGWVSYTWNHASKYSYVKLVEKEGYYYILGCGFYPDSAAFLTQQLIAEAVAYALKFGANELFQQINNPQGPFVRGDLYLWAYDTDGNAYAHGRNIAFVGQNRLDWKDSRGGYRNRAIIRLVRESGRGWVEYEEDGIPKRAYVEGFVDPRTGKQFILGCGYYPSVNDDTIRDYVKRGVNYLKANGSDIAFRDFSSYAGKFIQGPLRMFVYNLEGTILADAENPIFLGQNLANIRDSEGKFVVKEILRVAKEHGSGWITFQDKRASKTIYVEYVEVPDGKFIVGAGYWPVVKEFAARTLAEKAVSYFDSHSIVDSLNIFSGEGDEFLRGDLFVSVYSDDGICLAHGTDRDRIWFDEKTVLDDKGYPVIDKMMSVAKQGGGWVDVNFKGFPFKAYVKQVKKTPLKSNVAAQVVASAGQDGKEVKKPASDIVLVDKKVTWSDSKTEKKTDDKKVSKEKSETKSEQPKEWSFLVVVGYYL
ncbi:TPA: hypothetical protein DDZ86_00460 [Candidatus Dependentiae bacterium]|nr:MAG: hypothetical protein UW09_C0002G0031 [candidate division TM6 bacterium GW2011_GWF2_43_87]HBL98101.1 hypothetical protein [Candidatus Dependentiae bacterium]